MTALFLTIILAILNQHFSWEIPAGKLNFIFALALLIALMDALKRFRK